MTVLKTLAYAAVIALAVWVYRDGVKPPLQKLIRGEG